MTMTMDNPNTPSGLVAKSTAGITLLFASVHPTVWVLVVFTAIDYLTGIIAAVYFNKNLDSGKAKKGAISKGLIFMFVGMAHILESLAEGKVELPIHFASAITGFFIVSEFISIVENLAMCDVGIPKFVIDALVKIKPRRASQEDLQQLAMTATETHETSVSDGVTVRKTVKVVATNDPEAVKDAAKQV